MAGCTEFPDRPPMQRDRDLLEVEMSSNSSDVVNMFEDCGSNVTATRSTDSCNV